MRHTLKITDLNGYEVKHSLATSFGQGSDKQLHLIVNVSINRVAYRVTSHRSIVIQTPDLVEAIEAYNEEE
jgi:hypothetical protein